MHAEASFEVHLYGGYGDTKRHVTAMFCDALGEPSEKCRFEQQQVDAQTVQVKNLAISPHPGIFISENGDSVVQYTQERGWIHAFVIVVEITQVDFFVLCALDEVVRLIAEYGPAITSTLCLIFAGNTGETEQYCSEQAAYISRIIGHRSGLTQPLHLPWYVANAESISKLAAHSVADLILWITTKSAICTRQGAWDEAQVGDVLDLLKPSLKEKQNPHPICVIDQEPILPGQKVIVTPCMHMFHENCMKEYLKRVQRPHCPLDRTDISHSVASNCFLYKCHADCQLN